MIRPVFIGPVTYRERASLNRTLNLFVTEYLKTGNIIMTADSIMLSQAQSFLNTLSNFTVSFEFAGCFFTALWQPLQVVWVLDEALAKKKMVVCACTIE